MCSATHHLQDKTTGKDTCDVFTEISVVSKTSIFFLHFQHLSEEEDFQGEWMFVESRPIEADKHNICPCGQTTIQTYFFVENKINGNRTFVGSKCIRNIDPRVNAVIAYFNHILH